MPAIMNAMAQLTIRASEQLVERVKDAAAREGRSMNEFVTSVLDAATNPDHESDHGERVRARLRAAGLLWEPPPGTTARRRHSKAEVEAAGKRAAKGTLLSDIVIRDRGPR